MIKSAQVYDKNSENERKVFDLSFGGSGSQIVDESLPQHFVADSSIVRYKIGHFRNFDNRKEQ